MSADHLLEAVPGEDPCGPDLEYDPAFTELERIARGRPEQQMGDASTPAEEPNWRDVATRATEILGRTKDLRAAVYLTKALVKTKGLAGLAEGMAVLRGLVERYWEGVHPQLDPDDDNDPTMRVNVLADLCLPEEMLAWLWAVPIVAARGLGSFSLRDIAIAKGEIKPAAEGDGESADALEMSTIDAAFAGAEIAELQQTADLVRQASEHTTAIEVGFTQHVGAGFGPDLSKLRARLEEVAKIIEQRLVERGAAVGETAVAADDAGADQPSAGPAAASPLSGEVGSRQQVVEALDKICAYFERHEPSSPVPILLQRAKRLVNMSFLEIIRDVASSAVDQVEALRGRDQDESD